MDAPKIAARSAADAGTALTAVPASPDDDH